jgi:hypothetical protein
MYKTTVGGAENQDYLENGFGQIGKIKSKVV